jgi:hypothetical protein
MKAQDTSKWRVLGHWYVFFYSHLISHFCWLIFSYNKVTVAVRCRNRNCNTTTWTECGMTKQAQTARLAVFWVFFYTRVFFVTVKEGSTSRCYWRGVFNTVIVINYINIGKYIIYICKPMVTYQCYMSMKVPTYQCLHHPWEEAPCLQWPTYPGSTYRTTLPTEAW